MFKSMNYTVIRARKIHLKKVHPAKPAWAKVVGKVSWLPFASVNLLTSKLMSTAFRSMCVEYVLPTRSGLNPYGDRHKNFFSCCKRLLMF